MNDLVGVTLEFEDGTTETSDSVTRLYMAAPDMYAILKDIEKMHEDGTANLPEEIIAAIRGVLEDEEEDPNIIRGFFRKTE